MKISRLWIESKLFKFVACLLMTLIVFVIVFLSFNWNIDKTELTEKFDSINFVYVDETTINVGDKQQIAVGFNNDIDFTDVSLTYNREGETTNSVVASKVIDNTALFEMSFSEYSDIGKYQLDTVSFNENGPCFQKIQSNVEQGYDFLVSDFIDNLFNGNFPGDIYSINEDNSFTKQNSINDAIKDSGGIAYMSDEAKNVTNDSNEFVICLDPGHGGSDPGACWGNIRESDINLKLAKYCANELKQYVGVKVVMTRDSDVTVDLQNRPLIAKNYGAKVFVSFHINSASDVSATGFEVWVQNSSSWRHYLHDESWELGSKIRIKLNALGLGIGDRGNKERDYDGPEYYPDGSIADYLCVLRHSRVYNIPAVLIEHGFLSNALDREKLVVEENLRKMGVADAEAIAWNYGLTKEPAEIINGVFTICSAIDDSKVLEFENGSFEEFSKLQLSNSVVDKNSQKWRIVTNKDTGEARIINVASGKAIDLLNSSATPCNIIQQHTFTDTGAQRWRFVKKDNYYKIETCINYSYVLDIPGSQTTSGTNIWLYGSNDSIAQRFILKEASFYQEPAYIDDGDYVISSVVNSNLVFDVAASLKTEGEYIHINNCSMIASQKWHITTDKSTGLSKIQNLNSGYYINLTGQSMNPQTMLIQYRDDSTVACQWKIVKNGEHYSILSALSDNICIDLKSFSCFAHNNVVGNVFSSVNGNKFDFYKLDPQVEPSTASIEDGCYFVSSAGSPNKTIDLDVSTQSINGGKIQIWDKDPSESPNQLFKFTKDSDGYYSIISAKSNKSLDIENGCLIPGTKLQQWDYSSTSKIHKWSITEPSPGVYSFKNVATGLCVHIKDGKYINGQILNGAKESNDNSQLWKLERYNSGEIKVLNGNYIISSYISSKQVFDIVGGSTASNVQVQLYNYNNTDAQKFEITTDNNTGIARIKNIKSNKYFELSGGKAGNNVKVIQNDYKVDSLSQCWKFIVVGNSLKIVSALNEFYVIDLPGAVTSSGTQLQIYRSNGTPAQRFNVYELNPQVEPSTVEITDGEYFINCASNSAYTVDLDTATQNIDGGKLQLWLKDPSDSPNQLFKFEKEGNGYYRIVSTRSWKSFDVDGGCPIPPDKVHQWSSADSDIQRWAIYDANDGSYIFKNVATGLVLDINGSSPANGKTLCATGFTDKSTQKWKLSQILPLEGEVVNGNYFISSSQNNKMEVEIENGSMSLKSYSIMNKYNNKLYQRWSINTDELTHLATIKNLNSNKYLEVAGSYASSGTKVWQNDFDAIALSQKWKFVKNSDGTYYVVSALSDKLTLNISGGVAAASASMIVSTKSTSSSQKFNLFDATDPVVPATECDLATGTYILASSLKPRMLIDLATETQFQNGGKVQVWENAGTNSPNQVFTLTKEDSGYYKITSCRSNKAFDIDCGCLIPGTALQQWDSADSNIQRWAIKKEVDDSYVFTNVATGLVMSVKGNSATNGRVVDAEKYNGYAGQKWLITPAKPSMKTSITVNTSRCTVAQMVAYYTQTSPIQYPDYYKNNGEYKTLDAFCTAVYNEAMSENIDPAVVFCQCMKETGWLQFKGDVKIDQFNFCGLGATGGGARGEKFGTMQEGIRAHVQHLLRYATTRVPRTKIVDPRWDKPIAGCAPCVEDLSGRWAVPGYDYGESIVRMMNTLTRK